MVIKGFLVTWGLASKGTCPEIEVERYRQRLRDIETQKDKETDGDGEEGYILLLPSL